MRLIVGLTAFVCAAGAGLAASAGDDVAGHCSGFAENNGISDEPCACIVDAIGDDADLAAAYLELETPADFEAAPGALKEAIGPCVSR